jgi:hypothetical protein
MSDAGHYANDRIGALEFELQMMGVLVDARAAEIERLRVALRAINRINDHPARFNKEIQTVVEAALSPPEEAADIAREAREGRERQREADLRDPQRMREL